MFKGTLSVSKRTFPRVDVWVYQIYPGGAAQPGGMGGRGGGGAGADGVGASCVEGMAGMTWSRSTPLPLPFRGRFFGRGRGGGKEDVLDGTGEGAVRFRIGRGAGVLARVPAALGVRLGSGG